MTRKPPPPDTQPAALPLEEAVSQAMRLLLEGHARADIRELIAKAAPGQDPDRVLRLAVRRFAVIAKEPKQARLGFCQEAARELFRRMMDTGDYAGALRAVQELAKLSDAYSAGKHLTREPDEVDTPDDAAAVQSLLDTLRNG